MFYNQQITAVFPLQPEYFMNRTIHETNGLVQINGEVEVATATALSFSFSSKAQSGPRSSAGWYSYLQLFLSLSSIDGDCYPGAALGLLSRNGKIIGEILRSKGSVLSSCWQCSLASKQEVTNFLSQPFQ